MVWICSEMVCFCTESAKSKPYQGPTMTCHKYISFKLNTNLLMDFWWIHSSNVYMRTQAIVQKTQSNPTANAQKIHTTYALSVDVLCLFFAFILLLIRPRIGVESDVVCCYNFLIDGILLVCLNQLRKILPLLYHYQFPSEYFQ